MTAEPTGRRQMILGHPLAWGFLAGALAPAILLETVHWWAGYERPNVQIVTAGKDISRQRGALVRIENESDVLQQNCRDQCDDLKILAFSTDNRFRVRVLDAKSRCIACGEAVYVTPGLVWSWKVAGTSALDVAPKQSR